MNRLHLLPLLALVFSCGEKPTSDSENTRKVDFSYELDTVMVDAGDDFIYLNNVLFSSGVSQDGSHLYNFDKTNHSLQIIDLENLKLESVMPLELEGPNGIGTEWISKVYETTAGNLVLSDSYQVSMLDKQGNKSLGFRYDNHDFEGEKLPEDQRISLDETLSRDGKTMLTLYADQRLEQSPFGIAVFDLENHSVRYKPMEIFKKLDKYRANFYFDGYPAGSTFASINLQLKGDTLIYSNSANNETNFYNLLTDTLTTKTYSSEFTTQEAPANYPKRGESEEAMREIRKEKSKEVSYGPLLFDRQNDVYWRFTKEMDHMKGDTIVYKTVLTAFDRKFEQLAEELLPEEFVLPYKVFVREGMIYTYLNVDDELAFVRLKPTISYE